ncbi:MAG: sodium:calcium antiporter, partial [Oscillospiraceae bacterium]
MLNILFLVIGFILLIKGADLFVDSSSALATRLRIPP